jgi:predicted nucleic acid-binding protein
MANFTVIYDSNVLYPAPLRDLLMRLALTDLYRARWTEDIHKEWMRNVLENRPDLTREQLERTRDLMNAHVRDCLVEGYQELIPSLELPDPDDRHVLAAAIRASADVIVTFNLKHFPAGRVAQYGVEAQHPDEFVIHLFDLNQAKVCAAAEEQRRSLRNPPKAVDEFLDILLRQGLPQTVLLLKTKCYAGQPGEQEL